MSKRTATEAAPSPVITVTLAAGPERMTVPEARLVATDPAGAQIERTLGLAELTVGTDDDCALCIRDKRLSRRHCAFALTEAGVVLRDLGSKNGTFVAGLRVRELLLPPEVTVQIGESRLVLRASGQANEVPLWRTPVFGGAVGHSAVMRALFAQLAEIAATDETLLLLGESGTGKEVLAKAVHAASPRRSQPLVVFDAGAVAAGVLESELFGHARGAFTGATADRAGALEQAHGGTLFLDEIGELPLDLQPKLLRALESRQFRRVGANVYRSFDARVIAATHRDLRAAVAAGTFREDLYFRLAVLELRVPPLRERRDDIELIVGAALGALKPPRSLDQLPPGTLAMLRSHDWPGNVRELRNTIARLLLFPQLGQAAITPPAPGATASGSGTSQLTHLPLREARELVIERFEADYVEAQLRAHGGSPSRAAEAMGVSRQFVHRLVERHGIRVPRARP